MSDSEESLTRDERAEVERLQREAEAAEQDYYEQWTGWHATRGLVE